MLARDIIWIAGYSLARGLSFPVRRAEPGLTSASDSRADSATAPLQEQRGTGFRARFDLLPGRRLLMAEHHGALRLEGEHAEQHPGRCLCIIEHDETPLLLAAQPIGQRVLGAPDRLLIKSLGDVRKFVPVA